MITAAPEGIVCTLTGVCGGIVPNIGGDLAHAAVSDVFGMLTSELNNAAAWLVGHVIDLINSTTAVHLGADWFKRSAAAMRSVLVLVVLPVLMVATAGAVLRQDMKRLGRIWGVGLPVSVLVGVLGSQFAGLALQATDAMCSAVIGGDSKQLAAQFSGVVVTTLTSGEPQFVQMIVSFLLIAGTVMVWLELVVRAAAVYVSVFFMPVALVMYIWPTTAGAAKRIVEIVAALILSKFVIVATLTLGLAAEQGGGVDNAVAGGAILLIAGFAPFTLLRLAPIVETAAIAHLEGLSHRPMRAASAGSAMAASAASHPVARLMLSRAGHSQAPSVATPVAPQTLPQRQPDYPTGGSSPGAPGGASAGAAGGAAGGVAGGTSGGAAGRVTSPGTNV